MLKGTMPQVAFKVGEGNGSGTFCADFSVALATWNARESGGAHFLAAIRAWGTWALNGCP